MRLKGNMNKIIRVFERKVVQMVIEKLLASGFQLYIDHEGEDKPIHITEVNDFVMHEMFACDEERLYVLKDGLRCGWVHFVYGNDGWDIISDYTINLEDYLKEINDYCTSYA